MVRYDKSQPFYLDGFMLVLHTVKIARKIDNKNLCIGYLLADRIRTVQQKPPHNPVHLRD